jgi:WD40 repeat protein
VIDGEVTTLSHPRRSLLPHRPTRRPRLIRSVGTVLVLALAGTTTACETDTTAALRFEQITRFGAGRALAVAATDSVSIIATTIGVNVERGDVIEEIPTLLAPPLADVSIASQSRTALLVDRTGRAELWALDDRRLLQSFDTVNSERFANDGSFIDIVDADSVARISSTDGSTVSRSPLGAPDAEAITAWFGPDNEAAIIHASGSSELWNGATMVTGNVDPTTAAQTRRAVGDPTGDRVVVGLAGDGRFAGSLVSIDARTGVERWRTDLGDDATGPTWDVGNDGRVLAVGDREVQLFGLDGTVEASWQLAGAESVASVIALGTSTGYAIVRARGSIEFVDANGAVVADVATTGKRLVDSTAMASSGGIIAADVDGRVLRWDATGQLIGDMTSFVAGRINDVGVSADGVTAAAAASDGNVALLELDRASPNALIPQRFDHPEGNVDTVAFVADGTAVVSGVSEANGTNSFDDTLSRWDISSNQRRFAVGGIPEPIMGCTEFRNTVLVSPNGEFFVAPFHDFSVSLRDTNDGSVIHEFPEHISIVWDVSISHDGHQLATSSDDWTVRVWDLDDFTLTTEIETQPGGYLELAFMPDGRSLVVSDISGTIQLLDLKTATASEAFEARKDPMARLAISPDGRYVAAGSNVGGAIHVWDTSTGQILQDLEGHTATVTSIAFTPSGLGLVSGSTDGTVRFWQAAGT